MAERVRVRRVSDVEGRELHRIVRRGGKSDRSIVKWRRAMVVLASVSPVMALALIASAVILGAVILRLALINRPGIVITSVPYQMAPELDPADAAGVENG